MKHIVCFDIDDISKEMFSGFCTESDILNKDTILNYVRSYMEPGTHLFATTACVTDIVTGEETETPDNGFTDGEYLWYAAEIYHFEKYNLKLNDDFIAHVLSKMSE